MIQPLAVSIGDGFSQLPEQGEALIEGKSIAMRREEAIEANSGRVVLEHQRRARLASAKIESPQNTGMVDPFEHFELALGGSGQPIAAFW